MAGGGWNAVLRLPEPSLARGRSRPWSPVAVGFGRAQRAREASLGPKPTAEGRPRPRERPLARPAADFVEEHANVVLLGEVGTGKTHLAIALGMACCQRGKRVRFTTAAELTNLLVESKSVDRLSRRLEQMARYDVVILDELGYVPFDKLGADLLFSFITKVYERRSLIVTTNLPFARWNEVFLDATAAAAVIDRIVHHATILQTEGKSYRLRDAERTKKAKARRARA